MITGSLMYCSDLTGKSVQKTTANDDEPPASRVTGRVKPNNVQNYVLASSIYRHDENMHTVHSME